MTDQVHHLPFSSLKPIQRGHGIVNYPIASKGVGAKSIHSGITRLPVGAVVPRHSHNAEEQVTVLEGSLRIALADELFDCHQFDSTFITAGVPHDFANIGDKPALVMVTYGSSEVTRTFVSTGETVEIGSDRDNFPASDPSNRSG